MTTTTMTYKAEPLLQPIQGRSDWRKFKAIRLENGVSVLVINDKESKTTAMSAIVEVGASADPRTLSGLAHFCEHMCFLGSEKYPVENEYKKYLAKHGGRSNASTSMFVTNYKFEVLAEHAEKAVDIFSNFFVKPMFTPSGTEREVQAVSSENSKNFTSDARRRLQVLKELVDPNHYYSKFSTGNSDTLRTDDPEKLNYIREALLAFHRKHYRPEKMTVVIAGPQPIATLEEWVCIRYSKIRNDTNDGNNNDTIGITTNCVDSINAVRSSVEQLVEAAAEDAPPFGYESKAPLYNSPFIHKSYYPVLLTTKPLKSIRKLVMMFTLPSDRKTPNRSPSSFLSHCFGHEGPGSIFATLQNRGLLSSLSAGPRTTAPDFMIFQVNMGLTEKGEKQWMEVVDTVFAYCRMLERTATTDSSGIDELQRIWRENIKLDEIFFNQTSPTGCYSYVPNICNQVVQFGTQTCLRAGRTLNSNKNTIPLDEIIEIIKLLRPTNCIIERCSEDATEMVQQQQHERLEEKWYGVQYFLSPIEDKYIASWTGLEKGASLFPAHHNSDLSVPLPNRYIPRTLALCSELSEEAKCSRIEKPIDPPILLVNEERWKLYHRLDDRYALPKSSIRLLIRTMSLNNTEQSNGWAYSTKNALLSSFLSSMFNEAMAQETYDASLAGLHWSLSLGSSGIQLTCFGFSDRLPNLALKMLSDFLAGDFMKEKFFESCRDRATRSLRTFFKSRRADSHALFYRDALLSSKDQGLDESLKIVLLATFEDVINHHQRVLKDDLSVSCLFSGNVSSKEAIHFFSSVKSKTESLCKQVKTTSATKPIIDSGEIERRFTSDIELHFSSQNIEEENGAVLCTYQSSIPSFKGEKLSDPLGLESSTSIRLLCHILREPLFNSLRTRQQLGYIVSSYYDIGISSQSNVDGQMPSSTPIDSISINVLSQKMPPPKIVARIDDFINGFRKQLEEMPESEIQDHADALATKLLKPIQKLQSEASNQYSKIIRYGPEVSYQSNEIEIPWDTTKSIATAIQGKTRNDLIKAWDRMTHPHKRSRIVSCVYGKKFPLQNSSRAPTGWSTFLFPLLKTEIKIVNSFSDLLKFRTTLPNFSEPSNINTGGFFHTMQKRRGTYLVGLGAVTILGLGFAIVNYRSSLPKSPGNTIAQ